MGLGAPRRKTGPYAALLGVVLRPTTWARADTAIPKPASGAGKPVEHQWFSRQSAGRSAAVAPARQQRIAHCTGQHAPETAAR